MLSFESVTAGYGRGDVLTGLTMHVEQDQVMCLIGPNGAGKSTVLKVVSGLLRPRSGRVMVRGQDVARASCRELLDLGVVHVPQDRGLFPGLTVWENLLVAGYALRSRRLARTRAQDLLQRYPLLSERRNDRAGALSGGQQKIIEILRTLILEPSLILMDEPSAGLDPRARRHVFDTISELNRGGRTILLVEQNARSALAISTKAGVLDRGQLGLQGTGNDLLQDPRVAELYLGANTRSRQAAVAEEPDPSRYNQHEN